jgi:high-affinity iron transporter
MLNAFMITLREGIEAFLIVAITLSYLRKSGRAELTRAVHLGIAVAVLTSFLASRLFAQADNQPLWEAVLALFTTALVGTFTVHVLRTSKFMRRQIEGRIEQAVLQEGPWAFVGVFAFTVLMIAREWLSCSYFSSIRQRSSVSAT